MNLYGFVGNDGVGRWDLLGLKQYTFSYNLWKGSSDFDRWVNETFYAPTTMIVDSMDDVTSSMTKIIGTYNQDGKDPCNCAISVDLYLEGRPGQLYEDEPAGKGFDAAAMKRANEFFDLYDYYKAHPKERDNGKLHKMYEIPLYKDAIKFAASLKTIKSFLCKGGKINIYGCSAHDEALENELSKLLGQKITLPDKGVSPGKDGPVYK